jgi:hypothetical protein
VAIGGIDIFADRRVHTGRVFALDAVVCEPANPRMLRAAFDLSIFRR